MRVYTAHEKPHAAPILVREGFSVGALLFGPIWLAIQGAWIPAGAELLLTILFLLLPAPASLILIIGLALLAGFSGRDLVRWSMAQSGYLEFEHRDGTRRRRRARQAARSAPRPGGTRDGGGDGAVIVARGARGDCLAGSAR